MGEHGWDRGRGPWRVARIAGMVIAGVVGAAVFALAFGWFVQLLWNWLMPGIFGLGTIGYWQAFGLVILGKLIFGSIGGHGSRPRPPRAPCGPEDRDRSWGRDRWGLWKDYWNAEGKEAFERYVQRRSAPGGGAATDTGSGAKP